MSACTVAHHTEQAAYQVGDIVGVQVDECLDYAYQDVLAPAPPDHCISGRLPRVLTWHPCRRLLRVHKEDQS